MKTSSRLELIHKIFANNVNDLVKIHGDLEVAKSKRASELDLELEEWSIENTGKKTDEMNPLRSEWVEDHMYNSHHIDWITLNSFYISSFTMFENALASIIEIAVEKAQPKVRPNDIRGNGEIDSLRKYLWLIFDIKSANSDLCEWSELMECRAVRNALVHSGGLLNKDQKPNLEKVKGFQIVKKHDIWYRGKSINIRILDSRPIKGFGELSSSFLKNIVSELSVHDKIKEA